MELNMKTNERRASETAREGSDGLVLSGPTALQLDDILGLADWLDLSRVELREITKLRSLKDLTIGEAREVIRELKLRKAEVLKTRRLLVALRPQKTMAVRRA